VATLFGFSSQQEQLGKEDTFRSMQTALEFPGGLRERHWIDPDGFVALGAMSAANMSDPGHFAIDEEAGVLCLFDGIVFTDAESPSDALIEPDGARKLLSAYLESGPDCLRDIEGNFSVAWWDRKHRRLTIGTDKIGQNLLFFGQHNGEFVFGSYITQLLASGLLTKELDLEGFADLLACEFVLGERTLFRDIQIIGPATYLVIEGERVQARQYWRIDDIDSDRGLDEEYVDELDTVWRLAVRRAIRPDSESTIGLTGGVDSRMILAAAAAQDLPLFSYTGGLPDSTDVLLARQAAELTGARHTFRLVEPSKADSWLETMVRYQGGFVATLHTHPCMALFSTPGHDERIQGIGGTYVRGFWAPKPSEPVSTAKDMPAFIFNRLVAPKKRGYLDRLWKPDLAMFAQDATKAHLLDLVDNYDEKNGPLAQAHFFYLHERCRKFLNKGAIISKLARDIHYPYLDHSYVQKVSTLKIEDRLKHNINIQIELIRRAFPRLLNIPYAKNLMPLSASSGRKWKTRVTRSIRRRLNSVTGFVSPSPTFVDNHDYARWVREDMRSVILDLLQNPNAAYRAYLNRDSVLSMLDEHFASRADNKALIAALVTFEMINKP